MAHSGYKTSSQTNENDITALNRLKIIDILGTEWQQRFGQPTPNEYDYIADIAWEIANRLPSDQLIKDAEQLQPAEILQSKTVRQAKLTKSLLSDSPQQYGTPVDSERDGNDGPKHAELWVTIGLVGGALSVVVGYLFS